MSNDSEFQDGKYLTAKAKYVLVGIVIVAFFGYILGAFSWVETPGHFLEKRNYKGKFYVLVFPEKDNAKNYKIPANLVRTTDGDGEYSSTYYRIDSVDFPNGGSPTFSDCYPNLKSKTLCTTDTSEPTDFYIQMTNERVE
jgi:hypothetical protein